MISPYRGAFAITPVGCRPGEALFYGASRSINLLIWQLAVPSLALAYAGQDRQGLAEVTLETALSNPLLSVFVPVERIYGVKLLYYCQRVKTGRLGTGCSSYSLLSPDQHSVIGRVSIDSHRRKTDLVRF